MAGVPLSDRPAMFLPEVLRLLCFRRTLARRTATLLLSACVPLLSPLLSPMSSHAIPVIAAFAGEPPAEAGAATTRSYSVAAAGPHQPRVSLHVEEAGQRDAPPIVLLHGLGASTYTWRRVMPRLAAHARVLAIDLRGHGRSDKPFDRIYAPAAQAELVRGVMARVGARRATLVGHSFGGLVALIAALQDRAEGHPLISRLVVISAPALPQKFSLGVSLLRQPLIPYVALTLMPPPVAAALGLMTETVGMGHITGHDIDMYAQPLFDAGGRHALIQTARQIVPPNADAILAAYRRLHVPTRLIWCRRDNVVPRTTGQRLARMLPDAHLATLDGCDHVPPEQAPRRTARLIAQFAARQ